MKLPPTGPPSSPIALVGSVTNESELVRHERTLTQFLPTVSLFRNKFYQTNVLKDFLGPISKHFQWSPKTQSYSTSPELELACASLREELRKTEAKVFVPMGNLALYALTGKYPISKWRGSILDIPDLGRVVPTYAPSYIAGAPGDEGVFVFDLKRAVQELSLEPLLDRKLRIGNTYSEIRLYLADLNIGDYPLLAFDIETAKNPISGWEMTCFALARSPQDAICVPLTRNGFQNVWTSDEEWCILESLRSILENPNKTIVCQNGIFDLTFLLERYQISPKCKLEDTMIAASVLTPDSPKGLDFLTSIYTREPYYKDDGKQYMKWGGIDEAFWRYNALDAAVLLEILPKQFTDLEKIGSLHIYETQAASVKPFMFMGSRGLRFNKQKAEEEAKEIGLQLIELKKSLCEKIGPKFNPASSKQVMEYFYKTKGLKPYLKKGKPTGNEQALRRIARAGYIEAEQILLYRTLSKYKSTYLELRLAPSSRARGAFKPATTKTGRSSMAETIFSDGGNLQTLPQLGRAKVRHYIEADLDFLMYEADLARAESTLVTFLSSNKPAIEAYEKGLDAYAYTAAQISAYASPPGLSYEEVLRQNKEKIPAPIGDGKSTWRQLGKTTVLALGYGMGADKFSLENELPIRNAKLLHSAYFKTNPAVLVYQEQCAKEGITKGLRNPLGRFRRFPRFTRPAEMANFIPQSTVADLTHRCMVRVYEELPEIVLLLEIHDALLFEIPKSLGPEKHLSLLQKLISFYSIPLDIHGRTLTIGAEVKGGYTWGGLQEVPLTLDSIKGLFNEETR